MSIEVCQQVHSSRYVPQDFPQQPKLLPLFKDLLSLQNCSLSKASRTHRERERDRDLHPFQPRRADAGCPLAET